MKIFFYFILQSHDPTLQTEIFKISNFYDFSGEYNYFGNLIILKMKKEPISEVMERHHVVDENFPISSIYNYLNAHQTICLIYSHLVNTTIRLFFLYEYYF